MAAEVQARNELMAAKVQKGLRGQVAPLWASLGLG